MKLIHEEAIRTYDRSDMRSLIQSFPDQCREAREIASRLVLSSEQRARYGDVDQIVVAGMGGSAIGSDVTFAVLRPTLRVPILTNRSYTLPHFVGERTLFVAVSYSGNTEETLACFEEAQRRGAAMLVLSSGGELGRRAEKASLPFVRVPSGQPPRTALGYLCIPLLSTICRLGLAPGFDLDAELDEAIALLDQMSEAMRPSAGESLPMALARKLHGALPLVYASHELEAVAVRWRSQFSENSKVLAYSATFPEMNHNEIEGWEFTSLITQQGYLIFLHDADDDPRIQARMTIAEQLIQAHARDIVHVTSRGNGRLARIFSLLYLADWTSFYLAILNGTDPTPVPQIDEFKARLKQAS